MPISQTSILSEIQGPQPISERTKAYYRRRLQNRFHRLILATFREQQELTGLNQKQLAERIDKDKSKVNRWLGIPSNLTLETVSDLLLGLGVDLDDPSVTPIARLVHEADQATTTKNMHVERALNLLKNDVEPNPLSMQIALFTARKREDLSFSAKVSNLPKPVSGAAISKTAELIQRQQALSH